MKPPSEGQPASDDQALPFQLDALGVRGRLVRLGPALDAIIERSAKFGVREIVAAGYFGVKGPMSAFTVAFQVPNLVRSLFADAAISAAFVPVFTELLEHGKKREAFRLAGSLFTLILCLLGLLLFARGPEHHRGPQNEGALAAISQGLVR